MTRVFVTGVTGQDGSYLAERLVAEGDEVHALVRPGTPPGRVPAGVVPHVGDLADPAGVAAAARDAEPEEIYSLGGLTSVAASWEDPELTDVVDHRAVLALLHVAGVLGARLVQASSAEIFGHPATSPQTMATPVAPRNPYGEAKAAAHLAVGAAREGGTHAVSVVLYNHESPRRPTTFVTRKITSGAAAIARGTATELVLGNLEARRDWGWAPDYVDALVRAVRADQAADHLVATGVAHSVRDFVAAAFRHAGLGDWERHVRTSEEFSRPTDAPEFVGDATATRAALGWAPTKDFDDIVAAMVGADLQSG